MGGTLQAALLLLVTSMWYTALGETQPFVSAPNSDLDSFHTFTPSDSSSFTTLTEQGGTLYIGARDRVYGRKSDDITKEVFSPVSWPTVKDNSCKTLPQSKNGEKCYSQVQIVQPLNDTHIFICGTNSLEPQNKFLVKNNAGNTYSMVEDTIRTTLCSFDPADSVTSLLHGADIFSTARPELESEISLVKRMPQDVVISKDTMKGTMSTFVSSFPVVDEVISKDMTKIYMVSDEKTGETDMPSPSPTITQVCANDIGGQNLLYLTWTSLLKVRLSCATTDAYPLKFDRITDMVPGRNGIVYGTFMTRHDTSRTNAVCSFRLWDIQKAFNSSTFWETQTKPYKKVLAPQGAPHPGSCASSGSTSKDFPTVLLNFMSSHNLVTEVVKPAYPPSENGLKKAISNGPLLIKQGEKFTKLAIEEVTGTDGENYDLVFVGKDNGQVLKFVSIEQNGKIETIELARYQPTQLPIISMKLSQSLGQLYVGTNSGVHQLSTSNCASYTKSCEFCDPCRMCVLARDPGCAWDTSAQECVSVKQRTTSNDLLQDVSHGDAQTQCGNYETSKTILLRVDNGADEVLGHIITNPSVQAAWFKVKDSKTREKIKNEVGKYRITTDGQLEIKNFQQSEDSAKYECQYTTGSTVLAVSPYNVQPPTYVVPVTPIATVLPESNGARTVPVDTTGDQSNGIDRTATTIAAPVINTSSITIAVALGFALLVLLIIIVVMVWQCRKKKAKSFSPKKGTKVESPPSNASPRAQDNTTNNNNSGLARTQSEFDDRASRPLLSSRQDHSPDYSADPESNHLELPASSQRYAKSLDNILDGGVAIDYIDEDAASEKGPVRQNSLREPGGRQRVPPARTKSMPGSSLYVVFAGKKLMCSTLQRNRQGTWTIEVQPNQSGMSEMATDQDDEVIEIVNESMVDGKEMFLPSPDSKSSNSFSLQNSKVDEMKLARRAFFDAENHKPGPGGSPGSTVQYMTSTPNSSQGGSIKPKIAPKPPHLLSDAKKQPLTEQKSRGSLRSFGQNSSEDHDSDSTVKGSSVTLKPEESPPSLNLTPTPGGNVTPHKHRHHNHHHNRQGIVHQVPTKEPTSDVPSPVNSNKKRRNKAMKTSKNAISFNSSAKGLDQSSGSSDGDDNLHGRDRDVKKNRPTPLDSPSKQSRTSSSSGDYKSARSSVVSEPCQDQR